MRRLARLAWLLIGLWLVGAGQSAASPFADWAAVVVAGDWRAHDGAPSEGFDNARRDVARALARAGFDPANVHQFSVRPERYRDTRPSKSEPQAIFEALRRAAARTAGGCLVYVSSHGAPDGVVVDESILAPGVLASMLEHSCGMRPTIVIISACYSGVFVPELAEPNRMVLTAARRDRTSFGCGQAEKYPFFDDCFLKAMPTARDFSALAGAVRSCVAAREAKEGMSPPSEPQLFIGGGLRPLLPLYSLAEASD